MRNSPESEVYLITDKGQLVKGKLERIISPGRDNGQVILREAHGKFKIDDGILDILVELEPGMPLAHPHSGILYGN